MFSVAKLEFALTSIFWASVRRIAYIQCIYYV